MKTPLLLVAAIAAALISTGCSSLLDEKEEVTATPTGELKTNFVFVPSASLTNTISAIRDLNSAVPSPVGGLIDGVLALALLGAGVYARHANNRATSAEKVADTVIAGVEVLNSPEAKDAIRKVAISRGTQPALDRQVGKVTRGEQ